MNMRWAFTHVIAGGQLVAWGTLYYTFAVLAPFVANASGTSSGTVALAYSVTLLVAGLSARVAGPALDRYGAGPVMLAGAIAGPFALVLLSRIESPFTLWVAFVVLGVAQAVALYEPAFSAVVRLFHDVAERRRALLIVTIVGGFASTVFVPLSTVLIGWHWRMGTMLLAGILLVVALPTAVMLRASHSARTAPGTDVSRKILLDDDDAWHAGNVGTRRLAFAFATHAFASAAAAVAFIWHFIDIGETPLRAAFLFGLVGAAQVPGRIVLGVFPNVLQERVRLPVLLSAQAISLMAIALTRGLPLYAALLVFGAANGAITLERATVTLSWFGVSRFGAVSGKLALYGLCGRAVAPALVDYARSAVGYRIVFVGIAAVLAAGVMAFAHGSIARQRWRIGGVELRAV